MQQDLANILEQQLHDVHLPPPVSWWPLAPTWWVLLVITIVLIYSGLRLLHHRKMKRAYRRDATALLQNDYRQWLVDGDVSKYLQSASVIIRRCCSHIDDGKHPAGLTSQHQIGLLKQVSKHTLSDDLERALVIECYQPSPQTNIQAIHGELISWIKSHYFKSRSPDQIEVS
jgi:hypothetical protein